MKLLVVATDPVGAADVRSALPGEDVEGAEVLVVAPAVNESALAFWVSDSDEAIAEAESTAQETAAALRAAGARAPRPARGPAGAGARGPPGESEPLLAVQDALVTFRPDRVLVFVRRDD